MSSELKRLLRPRQVAVMGGRWAESVILSCLEMEYEGEIWPVHPDRETIGGLSCFKSIHDLPKSPDAVFLGINRHATIEMVASLAELGAGGVVAFASGFAEVEDGKALQSDLVKAAGAMPVLGPNCYGMINYLDGALLWPDVHGGTRVTEGVAIITQSSNLSINLTMQQGGLPIAYMLTVGNQAMVDMAALIRAVAEDKRVTAIGLHIEGISNAADFALSIKDAKAKGKQVIAMKAGASASAQMMTLSHTASLAGAHRVSQAFLSQLGIGVVDTIEKFLQTLGILHLGEIPKPSIVTLSCSGGEASLIADTAARHHLTLPPLTDAESIRATVNPLVKVSNPFDYHTFDWGDQPRLTATFTATMNEAKKHDAVSILIIDFPSPHLSRAEDWQLALDAWRDARDATGARAAVLSSLPENLPPKICQWLMSSRLIPLRGFDTGLDALASAHKAGRPSSYHPVGLALVEEGVVLNEAEAKSILSKQGIEIPHHIVAQNVAEAIAFGSNKAVAMKQIGLAHKTEEGGVLLGINGEGAIRDAWNKLGGKTILIEEMIEDSVAELLVGVARDSVMGLHMVLGLGGIMAELLDDTALVMLPASRADFASALAKTKADILIDGFRGKPRGDRDSLLDLIIKLQDFALSQADQILEIDLNPILVRPKGQGVVAVDALICYAK